jgi:hypothetical protein
LSARNYFLATDRTQLRFVSGFPETETSDAEMETARNILAAVGGLDAEMDLIREAAKSVIGPKPTR